jgi:hypothetical protein
MDQSDIDKVMAELRAKYPAPDFELVPLDLRMGLFVLRNPSHAEHMIVKKMAMDEAQQHLAAGNSFAMTCVYPDKAEVARAVQRWPGMVSQPRVQRALAYLSGATDELEGKS